MKFGFAENQELAGFTLPADHTDTYKLLNARGPATKVYVGCAKWNRADLKGFYPRGTKDELQYYASQFNSIELNATFYNNYPASQIQKWADSTPADFRFFPKVWNHISHIKRLHEVNLPLAEYLENIRTFDTKLGMVFLQLHDNFKPSGLEKLVNFIQLWPKEIPLAIELRNANWFKNEIMANDICQLFENNQITNIITDTGGRRDLLHMRLTTTTAFIRFVGANYPSDYQRLDHWIDRLENWMANGLENLYFFVHQHIEAESPLLAAYFIRNLNKRLKLDVRGPEQFVPPLFS